MVFIFTFGAFLYLNIGVANAGPVRFVEENHLNYKNIDNNKTDWIQAAIEFIPVDEASEIPEIIDVLKITKGTQEVESFVVVRSSFYVNRGVKSISSRLSNPLILSNYSNSLKINSCEKHKCTGQIVSGLVSLNVSVKHELKSNKSVGGAWLSFFNLIEQPDYVLVQEFSDIDNIFKKGGGYSALYSINENLTWIQTYQIFSIRSSTYSKAALLPFFDLEKKISKTITEVVLDARDSIVRMN